MATFKYDVETGKVIPKPEWEAKYGTHVGNTAMNMPQVAKEFTEFKSQVDGTIIRDRRQLAEHNKRNGVTNIGDYGAEHFEKRGREMHNERIGNTTAAENDRRQIIGRELHKRGMIR